MSQICQNLYDPYEYFGNYQIHSLFDISIYNSNAHVTQFIAKI